LGLGVGFRVLGHVTKTIR